MQDREQLQFDFDSGQLPEADLEAIFDEALRALVGREPRPAIEARFSPDQDARHERRHTAAGDDRIAQLARPGEAADADPNAFPTTKSVIFGS